MAILEEKEHNRLTKDGERRDNLNNRQQMSLSMKRFSTTLMVNITIVLLFFPFFHAHAADAGDLINGSFKSSYREERIKIAKDILKQIELLESYLSEPKPSEISWVDEERVAIDKLKGTDAWNERIKRFYESPEFQHQKLKTLLGNIKQNLNCITLNKISLRKEMLCWAKASLTLTDSTTFDDSISILIRNDRLPKDIAKKAKLLEISGYSTKYGWYGRGIHEHIVIPYLAGKINK